MRNTLPTLLLASVLGGATLLAGCQHELPEPATPTANKQSSDLVYSSVDIPEPICEVALAHDQSHNYIWRPFVAVLAASQTIGGHAIYYQSAPDDDQTPTWTFLNGPNGAGATKIAPTGLGSNMYAVNDEQQLWHYDHGTNYWQQYPFSAVDVVTYTAYNGQEYTYFLGAASVPGGHPIYRLLWNGTAYEVTPGAGAVALSVGSDGRPWVVNDADQILVGPSPVTYPNGGGWFTQHQGSGKEIASTARTTVVARAPYGTNGFPIYSQVDSTPASSNNWSPQGGEGVQLAGFDESLFVVAADGTLWQGQAY